MTGGGAGGATGGTGGATGATAGGYSSEGLTRPGFGPGTFPTGGAWADAVAMAKQTTATATTEILLCLPTIRFTSSGIFVFDFRSTDDIYPSALKAIVQQAGSPRYQTFVFGTLNWAGSAV